MSMGFHVINPTAASDLAKCLTTTRNFKEARNKAFCKPTDMSGSITDGPSLRHQNLKLESWCACALSERLLSLCEQKKSAAIR
eukprot:4957581-Amphidinium_carterae.1